MTGRRRIRPRGLWLFAFALLSLQCTCADDSVNRGDVNLISVDEEWRLGQQLAGEVRSEVTLAQDPRLQRRIEQIGADLVKDTELADRPWSFYVVQDDAVNAFALPGGHVFVNTGLVEAAATEAELASVMAHEVAHVVARHSTERMTQAMGFGLVARLLTGGESGLLERLAVRIVGEGTFAKFSRDDEREADVLGQRLLADAGYDPAAMASMFETLLALRDRRPNALERFFSTHPMTEERVENARRRARDGGTTG